VYDDIKYISQDIHQQMISTEVLPNDVLLNITGGSLGRCAIVPLDFLRGNVSQHVCILRPVIIDSKYLHCFILSSHFSKTMKVTGSGREGLPKYNLEKMSIPLPPIDEQKRIVCEIGKWHSLIDDMESCSTELDELIKQAKSKILDLAIHSKLVPQDPSDEPASKLLKRIAPHAAPCDTSHYGNLPKGWCVTSIECLCTSIASKKYQIKQSEIKKTGKYPVISQSANFIEGYSDADSELLHISSPIIVFGDHTRITKYIDFDFIVGADGVKILQPLISGKYFYYLTQYVANKIENRGYSRHYGYLSRYIVPIPPREEQERIANRIEELFNVLDSISADL
jgi:type I restriction enzyme S subunit